MTVCYYTVIVNLLFVDLYEMYNERHQDNSLYIVEPRLLV